MPAALHNLKVQTLDETGLADASNTLASKVNHADNFHPDVIIGIRSGGYVVAEAMLPGFPGAALFPVTCCRPSTKKKQDSGLLKNLLRRLPDGVTSRLRIMEHIVLTQLLRRRKGVFTPNKAEITRLKNHLRQFRGAPKILIVDDAVDSGITLATVHGIVRKMAGPEAVVKTAVITVTTGRPVIEPDYLLYRYVLCRFPWSFDFKR